MKRDEFDFSCPPRRSSMNTLRIAVLALAIAPVAGVELSFAADAASPPAQAAPGADQGRGLGPGREGRPQLFSAEERAQYEEKMKAAKTPEERQALRKEMRAAMEQRAKEKGVTLPGHGGDRPRRENPAAQLFTPEERKDWRDKMRNAKDQDERRKLMQERHAAMEARAKEKGIKLPQGRGPGMMHRPHPDSEARPGPRS
jgi:hypothetical protein